MASKKPDYMNPMGNLVEVDYNNVNKLKKNIPTRRAQLEDTIKRNEGTNNELILWSITSGILILAVLGMLKNIKSY